MKWHWTGDDYREAVANHQSLAPQHGVWEAVGVSVAQQQSLPTKLLKRLFGETTSVSAWLLALPVVPVGLRVFVLNLMGASVDPTARVFPGTTVIGRRFEMGYKSFVNYGCHLDASASLRIGKNVHLGPQVTVLTVTHELAGADRRAGDFYADPVTIHDGVWIGARSTILPGVRIGEGVVIAAGSVVTADCEPNQLYAGVPAKVVKSLPDALDEA